MGCLHSSNYSAAVTAVVVGVLVPGLLENTDARGRVRKKSDSIALSSSLIRLDFCVMKLAGIVKAVVI